MAGTRMLDECLEAPERVRLLLHDHCPPFERLAAALRAQEPVFVATLARGSSDHAASYAASLFALMNGRATASIAPSTASRYARPVRLDAAFVLAISQSGASPDLLAAIEAARGSGALVAGLVNAEGSPLEDLVAHPLPQAAGPERSVAATKSFICSLAACAWISALWAGDDALERALLALPERLGQALALDWQPLEALIGDATSLYVIGRGPALAVAQEMALKLKETSALHAEAFSAAEVRHGPRAVIGQGFPVLALALDDPGGEDARAFAAELAAAGLPVASMSHTSGPGLHLPLPAPLHPLLDPIVAIAAFYRFVEAFARARGMDPDAPQGLAKVTRTV